MKIDDAPSTALDKPLARWLVEDSVPCPRCGGPRDSHAGCDHCRELDERRRLRTLPPPSVGEIAS